MMTNKEKNLFLTLCSFVGGSSAAMRYALCPLRSVFSPCDLRFLKDGAYE